MSTSPDPQKEAIYAFFAVMKEYMDPAVVREAFAAMGFKVAPLEATPPGELRTEPVHPDTARIEWYFGTKPKGEWLMTYLAGMKAGWNTDQWRAAIDAAMSLQTAAPEGEPR